MKATKRKKRISALGMFVIMLIVSVILSSVALILHDVYGFFGNDNPEIEQTQE